MMATYRAVKPWTVVYPDPIRGAAGDRLALGRRDDEYPGWVWATAADGRAGWVPESWLRVEGVSGVLRRDYTAAELPLEVGDVVSGELNLNGWLWATNAAGECGWVPLDCLAIQRTADLAALQSIAVEEGIPYQTLMASILHKYVTGRLVERPRITVAEMALLEERESYTT